MCTQFSWICRVFFNSMQQTQHFVLSPKSLALTEGRNQCLVCLTKGSINTSLCTWIFKFTSLFISLQPVPKSLITSSGDEPRQLWAQQRFLHRGTKESLEVMVRSSFHHPEISIPWEQPQLSCSQPSLNSSGERRRGTPGFAHPFYPEWNNFWSESVRGKKALGQSVSLSESVSCGKPAEGQSAF